MMLDSREITFIKAFAKWFGENKSHWSMDTLRKELGISIEEYEHLIKRLESLGAVCDVVATDGNYATFFDISPRCVDLARAIDVEQAQAEAPADIVDQLRARARKSPYLAVLIIAFFVLTALLTLFNAAMTCWDRISPWMHAPTSTRPHP